MRDTTYDYVASDGTNKTISYAETFLLAGVYSGVSPYHLASRVKQEVAGAGRFASSVTGTVPGFEGYYNFYNIGAYNNTAPGRAVASVLLRQSLATRALTTISRYLGITDTAQSLAELRL